MPPPTYPRIAVVADAHFHDIYGDYGLADNAPDMPQTAFRRLAETARSTRVFNESYAALHHTLNDIAARGIRYVVLLGDYSDDGQRATLSALRRVLEGYSERFGIRFYAVPGNHDIFGADGRHRSKRFLNASGGYDVATSDPSLVDAGAGRVVRSDANYCDGYPKALRMLPDIGFFGDPGSLHWETPFGASPDPRARTYPVHSDEGRKFAPFMDASYLVEPFPDVWLMMVDANVFVPHSIAERVHHDEDHADSTAAGWNAMLTQKPFVLSWMKDVAARAAQQNKRLLTFSHYPVLDPLDGTVDDDRTLLGATSMSERIPDPAVAEAILSTGIKVHFSGHVHVNDTGRYRRGGEFVINVSVPSLVAFPAGYKIIDQSPEGLNIETVEIGTMPQSPEIEAQYQKEVAQSGLKADRLLGHGDYGSFVYEHLGHLVSRRHLRREWPRSLAAVIGGLTLGDLLALTLADRAMSEEDVLADPAMLRSARSLAKVDEFETSAGLAKGALATSPVLSFIEDWYRFRMGSEIALNKVRPEYLAAYNAMAGHYAENVPEDSQGMAGRFALLFGMFTKYRDGLPSRDFSIDLRTGNIRTQVQT